MSKSTGKTNQLSVREVSEKFNITKRRVMGWCERGLLPNAKKVPTGLGFDHWQIPETDLEGFVIPEGRGRPRKTSKPAAED